MCASSGTALLACQFEVLSQHLGHGMSQPAHDTSFDILTVVEDILIHGGLAAQSQANSTSLTVSGAHGSGQQSYGQHVNNSDYSAANEMMIPRSGAHTTHSSSTSAQSMHPHFQAIDTYQQSAGLTRSTQGAHAIASGSALNYSTHAYQRAPDVAVPNFSAHNAPSTTTPPIPNAMAALPDAQRLLKEAWDAVEKDRESEIARVHAHNQRLLDEQKAHNAEQIRNALSLAEVRFKDMQRERHRLLGLNERAVAEVWELQRARQALGAERTRFAQENAGLRTDVVRLKEETKLARFGMQRATLRSEALELENARLRKQVEEQGARLGKLQEECDLGESVRQNLRAGNLHLAAELKDTRDHLATALERQRAFDHDSVSPDPNDDSAMDSVIPSASSDIPSPALDFLPNFEYPMPLAKEESDHKLFPLTAENIGTGPMIKKEALNEELYFHDVG
ncbi:hypothetical protein DXG03_004388 [Asterophora parasitica]|uniref:Uncharacterized protein n=1 Tax=Asterophora parasitica TaxID=117018 RepID=A0A9P7G2R5_9AGAR|nr:hypothetical protein DXG03_004388 [Asterophora parasitica]